jgi:GNAT superfamily N-acetyltransferase
MRGPVETNDVSIIAAIDRSERVDFQYRLVNGKLEQVPATIRDVPNWDPNGNAEHSVAHQTDFCSAALAKGGILLAMYDEERPAGLVTIVPEFEPPMAWFAILYVSRPYRRQGVAQSLWDAAVDIARQHGASTMYVSANPTAAAVGFYLRQGCRLADPVHPELYALEPEDIHLVLDLA